MIEIEELFYTSYTYRTSEFDEFRDRNISDRLSELGFKYRARIYLNKTQYEIKNNKICIDEDMVIDKINKLIIEFNNKSILKFDKYMKESMFIYFPIDDGYFMCYDWGKGLYIKFIIEGGYEKYSINDWIIKGIIE